MAGLSACQRQEDLRLNSEKRRIKRDSRRREAQRKIYNRVSVMISWRHMMDLGRKCELSNNYNTYSQSIYNLTH